MKTIQGIIAVALLLCILPMPYGYFILVRYGAMVVFALMAYDYYQHKLQNAALFWIALAVLFQPIFKISLGRVTWNIVDVIVAAILLFILFYRKKEPTLAADNSSCRDGLTFRSMGGAGKVVCDDCGFQKDIISFTHGGTARGRSCCQIGRQCCHCGTFFTEYNESDEGKRHIMSKRKEPLLCPSCGKICEDKKTRDSILFCPKCKGKKMKYEMRYIT